MLGEADNAEVGVNSPVSEVKGMQLGGGGVSVAMQPMLRERVTLWSGSIISLLRCVKQLPTS